MRFRLSSLRLAVLNMIGLAYLTHHKEDLSPLWKHWFDVDSLLTGLQFYVDPLSSSLSSLIYKQCRSSLKVFLHVFVWSALSYRCIYTVYTFEFDSHVRHKTCPLFYLHRSRLAKWEGQSKTIYIHYTEQLGCKRCFAMLWIIQASML